MHKQEAQALLVPHLRSLPAPACDCAPQCQVMKRRWAPLALLILAAACLTSSTAAKQQSSTALQQACGGLGQLCCARCPPGTLASGEAQPAGSPFNSLTAAILAG